MEAYNRKTKIGPNIGIAGHILVSGKAEIVNDVLSDPRYVPGDNEMRSLICAPLTTQNGTIGVINISHNEPVNYTAQDLKLFTALASQAAAAIENALSPFGIRIAETPLLPARLYALIAEARTRGKQ